MFIMKHQRIPMEDQTTKSDELGEEEISIEE